MRAVWSFWSKLYNAHRNHVWACEKHHLLSWILFTKTAMRHYGPAVLHTDDAGAHACGWPWSRSRRSTDHDKRTFLARPALVSMGKLYTYRAQREPFVHLDSDVFCGSVCPSA